MAKAQQFVLYIFIFRTIYPFICAGRPVHYDALYTFQTACRPYCRLKTAFNLKKRRRNNPNHPIPHGCGFQTGISCIPARIPRPSGVWRQ